MSSRRLITRLTKVMYVFGIIFLLTGLLLSAVQIPVSAGSGRSWTTTGSCGDPQNVNEYFVGDNVYLNGAGYAANVEIPWYIEGQPGSSDPNIKVAQGNVTPNGTGAYCILAYTIQSGDAGVYQTKVDGVKGDNYHVNAGNPGLSIVKTASPATYDAAGDVISYSYEVTNSGGTTLYGITVVDDKATVTCPNTSAGLAPGAKITCSATYTITQADLDSGAVTNVAYATDGTVQSPPDNETVTAEQNPGLTIVKTATPKTYDEAGDVIGYSYEVTNSGNITLFGITVIDDKATVNCPDTSAGLAPAAKITCTASYLILPADVTAGSVTNTAYATDGSTESATDDETVTFDQLPSMSIVKTATPKVYDEAGDVIEYNYEVTNTGNTPLFNITVVDNKAAVTCPDTSAGLAPDAKITCTASYIILAADLTAGSVTNTAYATDGKINSNTDSETVDAQLPALTLVKSVTETSYDAVGDILHYSYQLTNNGNITLNAPFTVSDNKATVTCPGTPASLAPTESITCTAEYAITQADLDTGLVTNVAQGHVTFNDKVIDSNTDTETVNGVRNASLLLDKTADETSYDEVGDILHYNYLVTNTGNVTLYAPFIVHDDRTGLADCSSAPASLAPGASYTCHSTFTIRQYDLNWGAVANTAWARGFLQAEPCCTGPVYSNEDTVFVYGIKPGANLTLEKTVSPETYSSVGQVLTYDYKLINTGGVSLFGPFSVDDDKLTVDCSGAAASLEPIESTHCSASYTITQADLDAGKISNVAQAFGRDFWEATISSNKDDATATATQNPELTLEKSVDPDTFTAVGDVLSYSYLLTNSGNVTLTGPFTVDDDRTTVTCPASPDSLAPGESITCTATYTIDQADMDAMVVVNHATGHGFFGDDPVNSNEDTATATGEITGPALLITKTVTETSYSLVGDVLHYSYELKNIGDVTLWGPFTVFDDKSIDETCLLDDAADSLAPGATTTCSATYTVILTDLTSGSVTNVAYAQGFFRGEPVLSNNDDETVQANIATPTVTIDNVEKATCQEAAGQVCLDFTVTITNLNVGTIDFFADLPALVADGEITSFTEDGTYTVTVCGDWPGITDRAELTQLVMSVYANWESGSQIIVEPNPMAAATGKIVYDPVNRLSCFPQNPPVFANPFCNKVDGAWKMAINLKNPNDMPINVTWTIDGGDVKSGTIPAFSSIRLGNFKLGVKHHLAVYWGEEGFLETSAKLGVGDCYNPPKPPDNPQPIPVTAVSAPAPVTEAVVLIPVTGADLDGASQTGFIRKLMYFLGLSFLGMAFIGHSIRNKFIK